jgi:S-(hydroxymethyl)glutathione dehydrogenase/alcohol dehydrogenase
MKAAVLTKTQSPLEILEVDLPKELERGQVLVRVLVAGICGSQLQEIDGAKGNPKHIPHLLGHEGCGIVEAVGPNVQLVKPGNKVVMHWRKGEGIDAHPAFYGKIKSGPITTFSQYSIVSENRVTPVSSWLPDELAALLGCALSTALSTIERVAKVRFGERVLVVGCGGVGLSMIMAAQLMQAEVVGTDIEQYKKRYVENLGARFTHHTPTEDFDVIIDTTTKPSMFHHLAPTGRYILIGQPHYKSFLPVDIDGLFRGQGQTIQATSGGDFSPSWDIPRYANMFFAGHLDGYDKLISHSVDLDHINEGIGFIRDGTAARVMVDMGTAKAKDYILHPEESMN